MLAELIFPYAQAQDSNVTLNRLYLSSDHSQYSITLSENKLILSISKADLKTNDIINDPISYIDNIVSEKQDSPDLKYVNNPPLLIKFPPDYTKIKLSIGFASTTCELDSKSLVIVKSTIHEINHIRQHLLQLLNKLDVLTSPNSAVEISKLGHSDLPIDAIKDNQKIIINDEFNSHHINSKITISVWELDDNDQSYKFLFKFSIWVDAPRSAPTIKESTKETVPMITKDKSEPNTNVPSRNLDNDISDSKLDSEYTQVSTLNEQNGSNSFPIMKKPPLKSETLLLPISPQPEKVLRALKIGNFKKEFSFSIEDGPDFRNSIQVYNTNLYHYSKSCLKLLDDLKNLQSAASSLLKVKSKFTESIRSVLEHQFNPILKQLHVAREFENKFNQLFDPIEKNIQFIVDNVCSIILVRKICQNLSPQTSKDGKSRGDMNDVLDHAKKVFETNSKEYYSWLNKYLSNEKGKTESKLLTKRKEFELSKFDYLNQLNSISNNQYMNTFLEGIFKFISLPCDKDGYLNYSLYKDVRLSESLYSDKYKTYLTVLSRFNSEKLKLRQMIEASSTNEELSKTIKNNSLDHSDLESTLMDNSFVDQDNIDLIFSNSMDPDSPSNLYKDADMSGILYTLGGKGKVGWHKEWIVLKNGQLMEFSDWRHGKTPINTPIEIALSNVKQVNYEKRQNCFEVNTSTGNRHVFQAINAEEVSKWIKALYQAGQVVDTNRLKESLNNPQSGKNFYGANGNDRRKQRLTIDTFDKPTIPSLGGDRTISPVSILSKQITEIDYLELVRAVPNSDNNICIDCSSREAVEWVSINFLSVFCVECASCHRNLGSHITKIRSLKLDNFDEEIQYLLKYINNRQVNSFLESNLNTAKPTKSSNPQERLEFIKSKYVAKQFSTKIPNIDGYLVQAVQRIDIAKILEAIGCGANVNMSIKISIPQSNENKIISLFEYSLRKYMEIEGSVPAKRVFIVSELLLLNGFAIENLTDKNFKDLELPTDAIDYWRDKKNKITGNNSYI